MAVLSIPPRKVLENNWYTLTCLGHEIIEKDSTFKKGEKYHQVMWSWRVSVPGEEPAARRSWTTVPDAASISNDTVQLLIAMALTSEAEVSESGLQIDLDETMGKKVRGNIQQDKDQKGNLIDKITAYAAVPKPGRPAASTAKPRVDAPTAGLTDDDLADETGF